MSAGHCDAGERCSCGGDTTRQATCALWKQDAGPEKIFGLLAFHKDQKPLIEKHCFGDCGKVSMAGAITDPHVGALWVCCETVCPWLDKQMDEPYGNTMSFGREHQVFLRTITDTPTGATS